MKSHKNVPVIVVVSAFLSMALVGCTSAPANNSDKPAAMNAAQILANGGSLKACMAVDPPFSYQEGEEYKSFIPELLKKFEKYADVTIEFVPASYSTIVASLQSKKCDFIGADLHATAEREKVVDFSDSIIPGGSGDVIFVRGDDTRFNSIEDLNSSDVTIAILVGSASEADKEVLPKAQFRGLQSVPTATLVAELTSKKVDAFATSSYLAHALTQKYGFKAFPDATDNPGGLLPVPLAWAARKDDGGPLLQLLNKFLAEQQADGTITELTDTYLTLENTLK